jgi:hypothetical protein
MEQLPRCPENEHVAEFLVYWSEKRFWAATRMGRRLEKRFGLSRATTLLHFVSGGRYQVSSVDLSE